MENGELFSLEINSGAQDSFSIEELLDFTDTDDSLARPANSTTESDNLSFSGGDIIYQSIAEPQIPTDICVPCDEIAELEWLSNFVEDSFSSNDLQNLNLISGTKPRSEPDQNTTKPQSDLSVATPCNSASRLSILSSPRPPPPSSDHPLHYASDKTSQCRTGPKGPKAPSADIPIMHRVSDKTQLCMTGLMSPKTPSGDRPLSDKTQQQWGTGPKCPKAALGDHPAPQKRKREVVAGADGRRCLHCDTDKTPQWRTGPMGPKTLCNACGVRYKSGRLVPEYRPMASPTFVTTKHSNSHRKVMELRRQKEDHHQFYDMGGSMTVFDGPNGDDYLIHQHMGPDFRNLI